MTAPQPATETRDVDPSALNALADLLVEVDAREDAVPEPKPA